jgi:hypothetical protein
METFPAVTGSDDGAGADSAVHDRVQIAAYSIMRKGGLRTTREPSPDTMMSIMDGETI